MHPFRLDRCLLSPTLGLADQIKGMSSSDVHLTLQLLVPPALQLAFARRSNLRSPGASTSTFSPRDKKFKASPWLVAYGLLWKRNLSPNFPHPSSLSPLVLPTRLPHSSPPLVLSPSLSPTRVPHSRSSPLSPSLAVRSPPLALPHSLSPTRSSHFALRTSHFALPSSHFPLPSSLFALRTSHFALGTSLLALRTPHFALRTSHSALRTSHFAPHSSLFATTIRSLPPLSLPPTMVLNNSGTPVANKRPASDLYPTVMGLPPRKKP